MKNPVVVIGLGEIGSVIARGCLKTGRSVVPVLRNTDMQSLVNDLPDPKAVVVAVGEADLQAMLKTIPENWRDRLILLQNELLPRDWQQYDLENPTIISVWFEKKQGMDSKVVVPSVVYGPLSPLLIEALATLNIPVNELASEDELLFELVRKNLYILTTNIAGLKTGGNVSQLWGDHREIAESVANEILQIQLHLTGQILDRPALITAMVTAFEGDPDHGCMGRSAPARLQRALDIAKEAKLDVPALEAIANGS